jgi:hypothetical protein
VIATIAIDPGASGGIAWTDADGVTQAEPMPQGMTALCDAVCILSLGKGTPRAIVEKVGTYMPGNAGPSAATFARHCGHIEAALYCHGIPFVAVTPQAWMKAGGFSAAKYHPADYKALPDKARKLAHAEAVRRNKRDIQEAMQRRYPHLSVTLKVADALALLAYAQDKGAM